MWDFRTDLAGFRRNPVSDYTYTLMDILLYLYPYGYTTIPIPLWVYYYTYTIISIILYLHLDGYITNHFDESLTNRRNQLQDFPFVSDNRK
jgi:hypothetical protein